VLPLHTFTPRHFESEDGENQPLSAAAREVARDRGAKKAAGTWEEEKTQRYTTERHKSGRIVADKTADTDCSVQDPLVEGESEEVPI